MTDLEAIKAKIDVVELIGRYLPLKKAGVNYKGLCPFHMEDTPSFVVSQDKQIWHCFGCGKGGDVFKFVMEKEGMTFGEALSFLADQVGVTLSKMTSQSLGSRKTLLAINELAAKYFTKALMETPPGKAANEYLIARGVEPNTIEKFRLGYAPTQGQALVKFLSTRGFGEGDIEKSGLVVRKGRSLYDKFVGRIMFPLADALGRVVAFTGRTLDENNGPKYLNSPETPIFHKSDILYGLHLAKDTAQKTNRLILVEGQMDTIASWQAGVMDVAAISGTALTESQLNIINRYAREIVLALDGDSAGGEATKRAVELAAKFDISIKVADLGEYKDPGELIKSGQSWAEVVEAAQPVFEYFMGSALKKYDASKLEDRKQMVRELLPLISKLADPVEKDHYIKELGRTVGVDAGILYDALKKLKPEKNAKARESGIKTLDPTPEDRQQIVTVLPLVYPALLKLIVERGEGVTWTAPLANNIYQKLKNCYNSGDSFDLAAFLNTLDEPDRSKLLELMLIVEQSYAESAPEDLDKELIFYLDLLRSDHSQDRRKQLAEEIARVERSGDQAKLKQLLEELRGL